MIELSQSDGVDQEKLEFSVDGLIPAEVEMAKKHGFIKETNEEDDKHEVKADVKTEDNPAEEVKPTFDEVEAKEDLIGKYTPNEKALYWKWKTDKKKRQEYQTKYEELKAESELRLIKEADASNRLAKIKEALRSGQELTVEQLLDLAEHESKSVDDSKKPLTVEDLKRYEEQKTKKESELSAKQNALKERYQTTERIGKEKYENFEDIVKLAEDVVSASPVYKDVLNSAFNNDSIDEDELASMVYDVAKLNPKFKDLVSTAKGSVPKGSVEKAVKNSEKKISSATLGSSKSSLTVSEKELTVEDANRLTTAQWMKLKPETKKRILMGINP